MWPSLHVEPRPPKHLIHHSSASHVAMEAVTHTSSPPWGHHLNILYMKTGPNGMWMTQVQERQGIVLTTMAFGFLPSWFIIICYRYISQPSSVPIAYMLATITMYNLSSPHTWVTLETNIANAQLMEFQWLHSHEHMYVFKGHKEWQSH